MNKEKYTVVTIDRATYSKLTALSKYSNKSNTGFVRDIVNALWDESLPNLLKSEQAKEAMDVARSMGLPASINSTIDDIVYKLDSQDNYSVLKAFMHGLIEITKQRKEICPDTNIAASASAYIFMVSGYVAGFAGLKLPDDSEPVKIKKVKRPSINAKLLPANGEA